MRCDISVIFSDILGIFDGAKRRILFPHPQEKDKAERQKQVERKTTPHFWNLNEDPQLSNMVVHLAKPGLCGCVGVSVGGQSHA